MKASQAPNPRLALEERLALMAPSRRLRLAVADRFARRHAEGRAVRVLDAGCGDGLLSLSMAKRHPAWQIVGMDIDAGLLAGAQARAKARKLSNVEFLEADLTRSLPRDDFDVVLALECLTEIPDDFKALRSTVKALASNGLFIVQVPDSRWTPILPGSTPRWRNEVRHGYNSDELSQALRAVGLSEIGITPTFHSLAMAAQEIRDRIKNSHLIIRLIAFPLMLASVRLELWGVRIGRANALMAVAKPGS